MKSLINKAWFDSQISARKISQRKLAGMLGVDPSAMSLLLHGKRKMSVSEAGSLAKVLDVSIDDVLRHSGVTVPNHTGRNVPIVGVAGEQLEVKMTRPQGQQSAEAPAGCQGCRALRVETEGSYMYGWLLFYLPSKSVSPEALGRLCVVKLVGDNRLYVRHVARGYETGWYTLNGMGAAPAEHVRLESASPVCWIKQ